MAILSKLVHVIIQKKKSSEQYNSIKAELKPKPKQSHILFVLITKLHLLFGEDGAGLQDVVVERCVLESDIRWCSGTFQVQVAHYDIQHCCNSCQLHAIKHGWHLGRDAVGISFTECTHGVNDPWKTEIKDKWFD